MIIFNKYHVIVVLTLKNYPNKAFIMVARQLKIVSQVDTFKISSIRKIQYAFKKLACLIVIVKDIFDIYLNNIYQVWPLQESIQYCKNRIRSILTWTLSVGMVQHTTVKISMTGRSIWYHKILFQRTLQCWAGTM